MRESRYFIQKKSYHLQDVIPILKGSKGKGLTLKAATQATAEASYPRQT